MRLIMKTVIVTAIVVTNIQDAVGQVIRAADQSRQTQQRWWHSSDAGLTWQSVTKPVERRESDRVAVSVVTEPAGQLRVRAETLAGRRWWIEVWELSGQLHYRSPIVEGSPELVAASGLTNTGVYMVHIVSDGIPVSSQMVMVVR